MNWVGPVLAQLQGWTQPSRVGWADVPAHHISWLLCMSTITSQLCICCRTWFIHVLHANASEVNNREEGGAVTWSGGEAGGSGGGRGGVVSGGCFLSFSLFSSSVLPLCFSSCLLFPSLCSFSFFLLPSELPCYFFSLPSLSVRSFSSFPKILLFVAGSPLSKRRVRWRGVASAQPPQGMVPSFFLCW